MDTISFRANLNCSNAAKQKILKDLKKEATETIETNLDVLKRKFKAGTKGIKGDFNINLSNGTEFPEDSIVLNRKGFDLVEINANEILDPDSLNSTLIKTLKSDTYKSFKRLTKIVRGISL